MVRETACPKGQDTREDNEQQSGRTAAANALKGEAGLFADLRGHVFAAAKVRLNGCSVFRLANEIERAEGFPNNLVARRNEKKSLPCGDRGFVGHGPSGERAGNSDANFARCAIARINVANERTRIQRVANGSSIPTITACPESSPNRTSDSAAFR